MVFAIHISAFGILTSAGTIIYDAPNALALERNATLATGWMMEGGGWYSSNTGKTVGNGFVVSETYLFLQKEKQEPK